MPRDRRKVNKKLTLLTWVSDIHDLSIIIEVRQGLVLGDDTTVFGMTFTYICQF